MRILFLILLLSLTACAPRLAPYKIDVQQGNVVTQDMVSKLQPGMSKSQVRFILGTPLITDLFHPDRWDYVYLYEKAGKLKESRKITVVFDGDSLKHVEGDIVPTDKNANSNPGTAPATDSGDGKAKTGDATLNK